jgi:hypothetical protein
MNKLKKNNTRKRNTQKRLKAKMLEALERALGVVSVAATQSGIGRTNHYLWIKNDEEYRAAVDSLQDVALDFAETQLLKNVRDGDIASVIFYLKCKGKRRGYVERQEIQLTDEVTVDFTS